MLTNKWIGKRLEWEYARSLLEQFLADKLRSSIPHVTSKAR